MSAKQAIWGLNSIAPPAQIMFHGLSIVPGNKRKNSDIGSHPNFEFVC